MAELTPEQQFNQISNAIRTDDSDKLSALMTAEASTEEAIEEETPAPEIKEPEVPDDNKEEPSPSDKTEENGEEVKEEAKPEPTELDKLKDQLEKLGKENHALRSQAGRVPHVQRRIKELDAKLEALEKARTSPSSQPSAKIQPKVQEMLKGIETTDPDLAAAIAAAIAEATNGVAEHTIAAQEEDLKATRKAEYAAYQESEVTRLLEMYPNAPLVVASASWAEWKKEQPDGIVRLAMSDNADELASAFNMYAAAMRQKYPDLVKAEDDKAPAVTPDNQSEQAQRVEAERLRKKQTAAPVGSKTVAGKVEIPDDPEALFKKFSEQIRKERTG